MVHKVDIVLLLCLLLACVGYSQESEKTSLCISERSDGTLGLVFRLGGWSVASYGDYCGIEAEGMCLDCGVVGTPALPTMSTLITLPAGSSLTQTEYTCREQAWSEQFPNARPLRPTAGPTLKDEVSNEIFPDEYLYNIDTLFRGGDVVEVDALGVMGDKQLFRVTVRPFAYNPARRTIEVTGAIDATFKASSPKNITGANNRYLIVSRPDFRDGLQPFVRWKRQEGYHMEELYVDTNQRDSIKASIAPYFAHTAPGYMLLVGDAEQIQSFIGTTHPEGTDLHVTDLYYAEHTGDYLPDAIVGRWPVNDTAELRAVMEKTLRYEQYSGLDTAKLKRVLLVAGRESNTPAPVTTNGQVNYVAREGKSAHPPLDTVVYRNPDSGDQRDAILDDLRQGASMLNYTAHCTTVGWSNPSVSFTSIDTLGNTQPLIYVNNCCKSNEFAGTGFGEQLLRKPVGGAVGVVGATNSTLWNEDYYWAVGPKYPFSLEPEYDSTRQGAFDYIWYGKYDGISVGELMTLGNLAVSAFGSPYDKFYWEIYCLLGDPSLKPYIGVPQPIELSMADTPLAGQTELPLTVQGATCVSVMQGDSVLAVWRNVEMVDSAMQINLPLCHSLDTGLLTVTATAYMHIPAVVEYNVTSAINGLGVYDIVATDSCVALRLANLGDDTLLAVAVQLIQDSADIVEGAVLETQPVVVDTLLPGSDVNLSLPFAVALLGQQPIWKATLTASVGATATVVHMVYEMEVVFPAATFRLLKSDSTAARSILPQHSYMLETSVNGAFDSICLKVTALPSGDVLVDTLSSQAAFVSPMIVPDTVTHLRIESTLGLGNHCEVYNYYFVAGQRGEGFETYSYPWSVGGTQGWQLDSSACHSGRLCMRTGPIGDRQTSDLSISVLLSDFDTISFWIKTSTEIQCDKVYFSVDGANRTPVLFGQYGWTKHSYMLRPGRHTLRWRYVKDDSGSSGSDCAWIDDLTMPLALWDSAYGWFPPQTVGIEPVTTHSVHVYPNPSDGIITVSGIEDNAFLRVLDVYGREVYSHKTPLSSPINLSVLHNGVYILQCFSGGQIHNIKIVIDR